MAVLPIEPCGFFGFCGAFVGVAAVAAGFETEALSRVSGRSRATAATAVLVVAIAAGIEANHWGPLDVGRLDWSVTPSCAGTRSASLRSASEALSLSASGWADVTPAPSAAGKLGFTSPYARALRNAATASSMPVCALGATSPIVK